MLRSSSYKRPYNRRNHAGSGEKQQQETQEPFFSSGGESAGKTKKNNSFFQAKLAIGKSDDHFEKEADHVADKVVSQKNSGPVVQQKEITSVQRLATSKEDEKPSTNDMRMLKDKELQEKPLIQKMTTDPEKEKEKNTVQKKDDPLKKEEEKVQKKPVDEKEEDKGMVQKKDDPLKKEEEKIQKKPVDEKEEERGIAQKKSEGASTASPALSSKIESNGGRGSKMPDATLSEMQTSFNSDFSKVKIHTDDEAVSMNRDLEAQAFTHGNNIYFNRGKYDPQSSAGKHLLAHELTHVVQQGAAGPLQGDYRIQPYRPKKKFNFGKKDTADLAEESFNVKKDKASKPWIEKISIHFDQLKQDSEGAWMPAGNLFAVYHANAATPTFSAGIISIPMFISFPVSGGKHTELYTHPGVHTVHRIEGVGYHNASEKDNEGPNKRYVKEKDDFNSNMSFAIFFHKGEAIHRGALDIGSHGCVHVDWGSSADEGDTEQLRRLNYHSVIGLTKVVVSYNPAILPFLCCKRYEHKGTKKGVGGAPCDKTKAETCKP